MTISGPSAFYQVFRNRRKRRKTFDFSNSVFSVKARLFLIDYYEMPIQSTTDNLNRLRINFGQTEKS